MTRFLESVAPSANSNQLIDQLLEQIATRLQAGDVIDLSDYIRQYPEQAERLQRLLPTMLAVAEFGKSAASTGLGAPTGDSSSLSGTLGDFCIVREIGRGGMGIVYEAEQISLQRRVALKVLPFAAVLDPKHLQRFKNEALAAAQLNHPHIVDVLGVGCDRGTHFYAMRYIDGCTLAQVIEAMLSSEHESWKNEVATNGASQSGFHAIHDGLASTQAVLTTLGIPQDGRHSQDSLRIIAALIADAAEALQHAHEQGVIHRDIKPSNLMLDRAGKIWITDFGLAHIETGATLTMTGDLLGTLRYMSPEQARGGQMGLDHRTDIYSLGATLYELLTCKPVFEGIERNALLRKIAEHEPCRPSQLNPSIPRDVETIALKALEKQPEDRYLTAVALADDLRRFIGHLPIQGRPANWLTRLRKFAQRNKVTVAAGILIVASLLIGTAVSTWLAFRAASAERQSLSTLVDLQQVTRQWAMSETLTGDPQRADAAIRLAEAAKVSKAWTEILRAQCEIDQGQHQAAVARLKPAADEGHPNGDDESRLAALYLLAFAHLANGLDTDYLAYMQQAQAIPHEPGPEAGLFKAQAELWPDPQRAILTLEAAARKRVYPVSLSMRGTARALCALESKDQDQISEALRDVQYAEQFAGKSPFVRMKELEVHTAGYEIANLKGDSRGASFHLAELTSCVRELEKRPTSFAYNLFILGTYERLGEFENLVDAANRVEWGESTWIEYPAAYFYKHLDEPLTSLKRFEQLRINEGNPHRLLALAHFLADIDGRRGELEGLVDRILASDSMTDAQFRALYVLALLGKSRELREHAIRLRQRARGRVGSWGEDEALRFFAGEWDEQRALEEVSTSILQECVMHYAIGMQRLAASDRAAARARFEQCIQTGAYIEFEYWWAKGYLARMERDPSWPAWIENQ